MPQFYFCVLTQFVEGDTIDDARARVYDALTSVAGSVEFTDDEGEEDPEVEVQGILLLRRQI